MFPSSVLRFLSVLILGSPFNVLAFECSVETFAAVIPANASVGTVNRVWKGQSFGIWNDESDFMGNATDLPMSLCAITIGVQSSRNTWFHFGLFMPDEWDGRFIATGNPGFGGGINWITMGEVLRYSNVVSMSTDTGHTSRPNNVTWAINNPESVIDWGYRALHESTVLAKDIVQKVYGSELRYSYYTGCSNGGRMGWKEVQAFPKDYNGVLVGAPPLWLTHLHTWVVQLGMFNLPSTSTAHIPAYLFPIITAEVVRQCDPQDGVTDGIVMQPHACQFSSEALLCTEDTKNKTECLLRPQIDTLSQIFTDWTSSSADDDLLYPQFPLGTDPSSATAVSYQPDPFGREYLEGFVFNSTDWDWRNFSQDTVRIADDINAGSGNAMQFDLTDFKAAGGKVIHYHGLADPTIPSTASIYYYEQVAKTMAEVPLDDFYKMYMVPGMHHCGGSDIAPYYIAAWGQVATQNSHNAHSVPGYEDPQHDAVLAIMNWVENGTAPISIIATKWENNTVEDGIAMQRPLCPYPQVATYKGEGEVNLPDSWVCSDGQRLEFPSTAGQNGTIARIVNATTGTSAAANTSSSSAATPSSSNAGSRLIVHSLSCSIGILLIAIFCVI